ncbi:MAG: hypothetical protein JNM43_19950 [Planctomycetaceae bacterium]|nr:hypothetical protein [Planctomycetaceae bacterium]
MTTLLSDIVFDAANARLTPAPMTQDRELPSTFLTHHELIEEALKQLDHSTLIAGHKKDVVQTSQLKDLQHVAIYGWHLPHGQPIQPLYTRHFATYVDYSHGVRLVHSTVTIDGRPIEFEDVLQSEHLRSLLIRD